MKKVFIQGIVLLVLFFAILFLSKQINWVKIFEVQKFSNKTEKNLGDLLWESVKNSEKENKNILVEKVIDSIVNKICDANNIDKIFLKVHILNKDEVNAFAMPDGHLVVYSGLILNSDNASELAGVLSHEIAHIQLNHVMKKLVKEMGLSVLISITGGNSGGTVLRETLKTLSSSAFDRNMEREADIKAVDYLLNAKINPEPLANFLYKISRNENESSKYFKWISTHPDSKERAEYIIEYSRNKNEDFKNVISDNSLKRIKEVLKNTEE